jgi:hypothetical protein
MSDRPRGRPRSDKGKLVKWTHEEEERHIELWDKGYTKRQIGEALGKSIYSIICKHTTLAAQGRIAPPETPHGMIRRLCLTVSCDKSIAELVSRTHEIAVRPERVREIREFMGAMA